MGDSFCWGLSLCTALICFCDVVMQKLVMSVERGFIYVSGFVCENENFIG